MSNWSSTPVSASTTRSLAALRALCGPPGASISCRAACRSTSPASASCSTALRERAWSAAARPAAGGGAGAVGARSSGGCAGVGRRRPVRRRSTGTGRDASARPQRGARRRRDGGRLEGLVAVRRSPSAGSAATTPARRGRDGCRPRRLAQVALGSAGRLRPACASRRRAARAAGSGSACTGVAVTTSTPKNPTRSSRTDGDPRPSACVQRARGEEAEHPAGVAHAGPSPRAARQCRARRGRARSRESQRAPGRSTTRPFGAGRPRGGAACGTPSASSTSGSTSATRPSSAGDDRVTRRRPGRPAPTTRGSHDDGRGDSASPMPSRRCAGSRSRRAVPDPAGGAAGQVRDAHPQRRAGRATQRQRRAGPARRARRPAGGRPAAWTGRWLARACGGRGGRRRVAILGI